MGKAVLHTLSIWIVVIPFLIGIMNFKGLNRDARWILTLVTIALIPQLMTAFSRNDAPPFNIAYNLYTPLEFAILYIVFLPKFARSFSRRIVEASSVIYLIFCGYFFIHAGIYKTFIGALVCVNNVTYILWILLLLKQEYAGDSMLIQQQSPFTWLFIALVFYAPCTVITFALYQYIRVPSNPTLRNLAVIQDFFNILQYILFSFGLSLPKT